jgi:putative acetyltransferase
MCPFFIFSLPVKWLYLKIENIVRKVSMNQEDITHRRARTADSEAIQLILKRTLAEYEIQLPDNYSFSDIENLEEVYLDSGGEFTVLLRDQNIIGFFALLPGNNNQVELKRLYLTATERGQGLGKYLLELALKKARRSGHHRIYLETTSKFIEAVGLYRKYGFRACKGFIGGRT